MAKSFSFEFKIGAQLGSAFSSAFATASSMMKQTSVSVQQLNGQHTALAKEMRNLTKEQRNLDTAYKAGKMTLEAYNARCAENAVKIKENESAQEKLAAAIAKTERVEKAESSIKSAFATGPVTGFKNAITGTTSSISNMTNKLSSLVTMAATGFGLTTLVSGAMEAGESVYQLSTKLHMSNVEALQMSRILNMTGGSVESAAKSIMRLDKSFSATGAAGEQTRQMLSQYGVTLTDANGKLLPINEQLKNLSAGYKAASQNGEEQEFVMQTLGVRGMELTKTLQNYDEAAEQASKVKGIGLDVNQMHQMNMDMQVMKMQAGQFSLALTSAFAPLVSQLMPTMLPMLQSLANWIAQNKDQLASFAVTAIKLMALYKVSTMLVSGFQAMNTAMTAFRTGASALSAFPAFANPWTLAIMGIIAAIYLIYTHWGQITTFMTSTWNGVCSVVSGLWNGLVNILKAGFELLKAGFMAYINLWLMWPRLVIFAIGFIAGAISQLPTIIGDMVTAAGTFLMNLPEICIVAGSEFVSAAISWASEAYTSVTTWVSSTVTDAGIFLMNLPSECAEAGAAFVSAAESWASDAYNAVINWISKIPDAISSYISSAWDNIKATFSVGFNIGVSGKPYATGGLITSPHLGLVGEAGPEMIVPLSNRERGLSLWQQAGSLLGVNKSSSSDSKIYISVPVTVYGNADDSVMQNIKAAVNTAVESALYKFKIQKERVSYE